MEIAIIKFLQSLQTPLLDNFFKFITYASSYITFIVCMVFIFLFVSKRIAINFALCYGSAFGLNLILKILFNRQRPYQVDSSIKNILQASGASFPSGHAVSVTVIMTFMAYVVSKKIKQKWLRIIIYILIVLFVLLTYVSRMYLGQHFLSDVLIGGVVGLAFCFIFYLLYQRFQVKKDEQDDNENEENKNRFKFFRLRKKQKSENKNSIDNTNNTVNNIEKVEDTKLENITNNTDNQNLNKNELN